MTRRRGGEGGFTLVELLVVVVILGILSAVVVFAVRGAGDKGQGAALATDERTIRVAEEAHCAQAGSYVPIGAAGQPDTLVGDKFLSDPSKYHTVAGVPVPCGNGQRFDIKCAVSGQQMPDCGLTGGGGPPGGGDGICPQPDSFCDVVSHPVSSYVSQLLSLPSGIVLAFTENGISQYDPSQYDPVTGKYGAWSSNEVPGLITERAFTGPELVIGGRPGHEAEDCGANCGKVLIHMTNMWYVYDPLTTAWQPAPSPSDPSFAQAFASGSGGVYAPAAQILVDPCGVYCGQFLIVYFRGQGSPGGPFAELWDPVTAAFTPLGPVVPNEQSDDTSVVPLKDGRVLVTASARDGAGSTYNKWTRYFNPATFSPTKGFDGSAFDDHLIGHLPSGQAVLANGDVLFVSGGSEAEVFQMNNSDGGSPWKVVPSCGAADNEYCEILTAFDSGRQVLAKSSSTTDTSTWRTWRFDSTTGNWTRTKGNPTRSESLGVAAVIGGQPCEAVPKPPYCGNVVLAGHNGPASSSSSELYVLPPR